MNQIPAIPPGFQLETPHFDPSQPFTIEGAPVAAPVPQFDPSKPFTVEGTYPPIPAGFVLQSPRLLTDGEVGFPPQTNAAPTKLLSDAEVGFNQPSFWQKVLGTPLKAADALNQGLSAADVGVGTTLSRLSDIGPRPNSFAQHEREMLLASQDMTPTRIDPITQQPVASQITPEQRAQAILDAQWQARRDAGTAYGQGAAEGAQQAADEFKQMRENTPGFEAPAKVAEVAGGALPYVAEAAIPVVGPAIAALHGGAESGGQVWNQAYAALLQQGIPDEQAKTQADQIATAIGLGSAEVFAALPGPSKGVAAKIIGERFANKPIVGALAKIAGQSLEGGTVMSADALQRDLQSKATFNPNMPASQIAGDAGSAFGTGAIFGGVTGTHGEISNWLQLKAEIDANPEAYDPRIRQWVDRQARQNLSPDNASLIASELPAPTAPEGAVTSPMMDALDQLAVDVAQPRIPTAAGILDRSDLDLSKPATVPAAPEPVLDIPTMQSQLANRLRESGEVADANFTDEGIRKTIGVPEGSNTSLSPLLQVGLISQTPDGFYRFNDEIVRQATAKPVAAQKPVVAQPAPKPPRPIVPETPAEPYETNVQTVRRLRASTIKGVQEAFPNAGLSREQARTLRNAAFPETAQPKQRVLRATGEVQTVQSPPESRNLLSTKLPTAEPAPVRPSYRPAPTQRASSNQGLRLSVSSPPTYNDR